MAQPGTKECNQCHQQKPLDQFGSANGGKGKQPACRECMKARRARWGEENRDKLAAYDATRRRENPRRIYTDADKVRFWNQQFGICLCCAKPVTKGDLPSAQLDHIEPLSRGGPDSDDNIAIAHKQCNAHKHNKTLQEHWRWRHNQSLDAVKLSCFEIENIITAARYRE